MGIVGDGLRAWLDTDMRSPSLDFLAFLIPFAIVGCTTAPSSVEPADAGKETGACIDGQCLGELSCLSEVCVDPDGATDEGGASASGAMPPPDDPDDDDDTGASDEATSTSGATEGTTGGAVDGSDGDGGFIIPPDAGIVEECSTFAQDCPKGQKCNAWASDVPGVWDATGCFEVVENPDAVGESCTTQFGTASGYDTCEVGAICWIGAGKEGAGECIAYCGGDPDEPSCPTEQSCSNSNQGVISVCLPGCDPIAQSCPEGQGCYLGTENFTCVPDASGGSGYGSPCEFINACTPGTVCLSQAVVGGCPVGNSGCCTPYCDVDEPDTCPGEAQECVSAYGGSPPIAGLEHVGLCLLPS